MSRGEAEVREGAESISGLKQQELPSSSQQGQGWEVGQATLIKMQFRAEITMKNLESIACS